MNEQSGIRVMICDDMPYICEAFKIRIEEEKDLIYNGAANSAGELLEAEGLKNTDVLLLDIQMETETAGMDIIPGIKEINPDIKIVVLTSYLDEDYIFSAFANGADDYCSKETDIDEIIKKVYGVFNGEATLDSEISRKLIGHTQKVANANKSLLFLYKKISTLSTSEYKLLKDLYNGSSYKEIAAARVVEVASVHRMASRILAKFEAKNMKALLKLLDDMKIFEYID